MHSFDRTALDDDGSSSSDQDYDNDMLDDVRLSPTGNDNEGPFTDQLPTVEQIRTNLHLCRLKGGTMNKVNTSQNSWNSSHWVVIAGLLFISILVILGISLGSVTLEGSSGAAIAYLVKAEVSTRESFKDPQSPQSKALKWMLQKDPLQLNVPNGDLRKGDFPPFVQRYIVVVFIMALVPEDYMDGSALNLLTDEHECKWTSQWKRSDGSTTQMGIICDTDPKISEIRLQTIGLRGEIPQEIASLPDLQTLALDVNYIEGEIPYVPTLHHLSLDFNSFESSLPAHLGLMSNLKTLSISENDIQGRIPSEFGNLSNLRKLRLSGNELTGGLAAIYKLVRLEELYLGFNSLDEGFSNDSFATIPNLKILDMSNNKLFGPLPDALWRLSSLEVVDFHFNGLNGHINGIPQNHTLKFLDVSENFLGGALPTTINLLTDLTHLDLRSNRFEFVLPTDMSALTKLETLLLGDNSEFGPQPLPEWLRGMTNLRHLSLRLTARTGSIPSWISELSNLVVLDLDWNHFSGYIPASIGNLAQLEYLMLNRNFLEGTIPTVVASLPTLKLLMVDNNRLMGELDACQTQYLVADCGDPNQGCPDCESLTMEVYCPCCTNCCFDADQFCNYDDWLKEAESLWQDDYEQGIYNFKPDDRLAQDGQRKI